MTIQRGYYSVLQFCPDPARFEVANLGVALLCPDQNFFQARVTGGNERVTHFFDRSHYDIPRLNSYKAGLVDRLNNSGEVKDRDSFGQFAAMQVNAIVMTPPQFCRVEGNAEELLESLLEDLVGEKKRVASEGGLKQRLREAFEAEGLLGTIILENVSITVPAFGREAAFPFAWQNGVLNLIDPVRFTSNEPSNLEQTACRRAVEGQSISRREDPVHGRCQLNVIGQFQAEDQNGRDIVRRILQESEVKLIESSHIESYIQTIMRTGKSLAS